MYDENEYLINEYYICVKIGNIMKIGKLKKKINKKK